jgi:hypothetical protein
MFQYCDGFENTIAGEDKITNYEEKMLTNSDF